MNQSRKRKIAYLLLVVACFSILIGLSRYVIEPSADRHELTQRSLGKVNPVSGTAQLVFMGFRGVAVTFLWHEAIELKKKDQFFRMKPVLESITLLQPNFIRPWQYQAWNLAYNISAEWEAVEDKYYWIREGIDFMKKACEMNEQVSDLQWYVGWLYYNRFGMTDEKEYLRELFKQETDREFAFSDRANIQDNFLKAYDWYLDANQTILATEKAPKRMGISPFMSSAARAKTEYGVFLAVDGIFGERSKNAWRDAYQEWLRFGRGFDQPNAGPNRHDFLHKMEYKSSDWEQLTDEQQYWAQHFGKVVNYYYWKKRAKAEETDDMQVAREAMYNANKHLDAGRFKKAIDEYERSFAAWRKIMVTDENMRGDMVAIGDLQEHESRYLRLISRLDLPKPKERPFEDLFPPEYSMQRPPTQPPSDSKNAPAPPGGEPNKK